MPAAAPAVSAVPLSRPSLLTGPASATWLSTDGELAEISFAAAAERARDDPPLVCHAASVAARLGLARIEAYDLLELFAFLRPAAFCLPTPRGLAEALGLPVPDRHPAAQALSLAHSADCLLASLGAAPDREADVLASLAALMLRGGWLWAGPVLRALGRPVGGERGGGLDAWRAVPEWSESAPEPPPGDKAVGASEARERLGRLLGGGAEPRPAQADYAAAAAAAFSPREQPGLPNLVLAEAGTGIGKTLGYIAPASLWAERNGGPVWVSTFTKALQRQLDQELDRLHPDPARKAEKVVVRKGRENYLCLLNLEEASQGGAARPQDLVPLALMARWAAATRDGDMVGGDFPSWLVGLFGRARTVGLTDRRGECVYAACPHYRRCFIERAARRARRADMVIANHALVMLQAAQALDPRELPSRYVFDEAHHVFDAADAAFSAHLSGAEAQELRRWIRGAEGGRRTRARGLVRRFGDLLAEHPETGTALGDCLEAAGALPQEGWLSRIGQGAALGPAEHFLALVRQQVHARTAEAPGAYDLQTGTEEPVPGLLDAAVELAVALSRLAEPLRAMVAGIANRLDREAANLDSATRQRLEAAARGVQRRALTLTVWRNMLQDLADSPPAEFVDWFAVARAPAGEIDIGFHRHWIDPTQPFASTVLQRAQGVLMTSATLRDRAVDAEETSWQSAEVLTGAQHLPLPARRVSLPSPFDHAGRTRVLVVGDVRRDDPRQVASAYRELFLAAGGGGLGLFTAISRLRQVHRLVAGPLEAAGIPLLAQHVDPIDAPTLVDMFRAETDACLLGTDAMRDGVDVPGRSLRLIVFDRVPWPRPDILHRARRAAFGRQVYDDMLTRLRLKQAYGRLLRRAADRGVFVMLDSMLPSRLCSAFPAEVEIRRLGLAEAVRETRRFLAEEPAGN